ncbi:MAG: hypothetical protein KDD65_04095 [Bacteroidetes bacterium]|nr:hypothetical protein [Bacteroidota bacterium]
MKKKLNTTTLALAMAVGFIGAASPFALAGQAELAAQPCEFDCAVNVWNGTFYCYPGGEWSCPLYERDLTPKD